MIFSMDQFYDTELTARIYIVKSFKVSDVLCTRDMRDDKHRRMEFSTSAVNILNSLEQMGYRVVTSGSFVASQVSRVFTG